MATPPGKTVRLYRAAGGARDEISGAARPYPCWRDRCKSTPAPAPEERPVRVETRHAITLGTSRVDYRAIAETIALTDEKGRTTVSIYTISYLADSAATAERPVAFVFNGGPGAAAVFLHLGARAQGPCAPLAEFPTAPAAQRNCPGDIVV